MKRMMTMLLMALTFTTVMAQSEQTISASRDVDADRIETIGGSYGLLLISKHNKLTINIINAAKKPEVLPPKANADGLYEYRVIMDAQDTHQPKVEVHRTGELHRAEFVAKLKPDFFVAYRIEEVAVPIRMADDTRVNDIRQNADEAELEFRTTIKNLMVKTPLALGAKVSKSVDKADKSINITNVVIPVARLVQARKDVSSAQAEYDRLTEIVNGDNATDADDANHSRAEQQLADAQGRLNELSSVIIYSDNTNNLSVDISDMGPRVKRCYLVLPLETERKVFTKEFQGYLDNGRDCIDKREYADARSFYVNALSSADCETDLKPAIMQYIDMCDSCILYNKLAGLSISKFVKLRDSGNATQQQAYKYASAAIEYLTILNNYNPDEFYTSRIKKLSDTLSDMPLKVGFTVVEWQTVQEGAALPDVEVWAYYGDEKAAPTYMMSKAKLKKAVKERPADYKQVGVSDAFGEVLVELDRSALPKGFLFTPTANDKVKPSYLDAREFMRKAKGDFLQKRFRMKMYKRTNKHI